jgi:hypothetical protein
MTDRWGTKHDYETELADEAERLKHEEERCNPASCDFCIAELDVDDILIESKASQQREVTIGGRKQGGMNGIRERSRKNEYCRNATLGELVDLHSPSN